MKTLSLELVQWLRDAAKPFDNPRMYVLTVERAQEILDALDNPEHVPAPYPAGHKMTFSMNERYDEVCEVCGATDSSGDDRLKYPCPGKEE